MKRYPDIDYGYRPVSYWQDETLAQAILKNIKGDFRREEIRKALAAGNLETIPEEILREALSENVRSFTGRIHPRFMGGEYLRDLSADEVEIARISLQSTTFDVISIREQVLEAAPASLQALVAETLYVDVVLFLGCQSHDGSSSIGSSAHAWNTSSQWDESWG